MAITVVIVVLEVVLVEVFRVAAVLLLTIGGRALVCAGAVINTFVEVLTVAMRVDLFMDAVTDTIRGFLVNIGVAGMLVDVKVNMFVSVMIAFKFAMRDPLEEFRC